MLRLLKATLKAGLAEPPPMEVKNIRVYSKTNTDAVSVC